MADKRDEGKMAPSARAESVSLASDYTPPSGYGTTAGVYVGGAGVVKVDMEQGDSAVEFTVPAGALLPIQVSKIYSTGNGTTATLVVALY